jgi:hypothetical protein
MNSDDDDLHDLFHEADEILGSVTNEGPPIFGAPVSEPPMWIPSEGWGTFRDYVVVRNDSGGTDVGCHFIPDDGGRPVPLIWKDVPEGSVPLRGLGEFARGILNENDGNRNLVIKIPADGMSKAEELVAGINAMETVKRALLQKSRESFFQTCGYGHDSSWRLVKAAPGLLRE